MICNVLTVSLQTRSKSQMMLKWTPAAIPSEYSSIIKSTFMVGVINVLLFTWLSFQYSKHTVVKLIVFTAVVVAIAAITHALFTSGRLRTNLAIDPSEFQQYNIAQPSNVTFCLKEFRSILSFCDYVGEVCK